MPRPSTRLAASCRRRAWASAVLAVALIAVAAAVSGCATSTAAGRPGATAGIGRSHSITGAGGHLGPSASRPAPPRHPDTPAYPELLHSPPSGPTRFTPTVHWHGQYPIWVSRTAAGAILVSLNQKYLTLELHSGTVDAGPTGWRWGPEVAPAQRPSLMAAFNGGFMLNTGAGGFFSYGRTAVPLRRGLASIVTYANGTTDIGAWDEGIPARGEKVVSVRQNLTLLINGGHINPSVSCIQCWGATLGGVNAPARSALGITADGHLVWAGGMSLTPLGLAQTLLGAHVVRAIQLDINPEWVAFDLYSRGHNPAAVTPVPFVPGQQGVPGQFLTPYNRDFFSVQAR
ncbi:phosphodiester glycosidase family protein [Conexibacter sp. DBS9H8]|uniref:phosphodiester glycosidase family protein n=1 Tax=Conexibacter sp. DBS9H8 TaxID=2937801 RepID=UPI00200C2861|nr:phosphodiester glycosidase family protein [Conexibacter sp. DBS9H8]